jgi:8-oxo-dGTP pyrophosphatase MutT (NUDIX family)
MSDAKIAALTSRLLTTPQPMPDHDDLVPDWMPEVALDRPPVPAAVLIALVRRAGRYSVLYTARAGTLRNHSGQVAFPGGRIDAEDHDAAYAALREANEEVALVPADAQVLGYMPYYFTGTNYFITPVVAVVEPRAPFVANPQEVDAVFEVPIDFIADAQSYDTLTVTRRGKEHRTWKLDHSGHRIWGITANLTRRFRDEVLLAEPVS